MRLRDGRIAPAYNNTQRPKACSGSKGFTHTHTGGRRMTYPQRTKIEKDSHTFEEPDSHCNGFRIKSRSEGLDSDRVSPQPLAVFAL